MQYLLISVRPKSAAFRHGSSTESRAAIYKCSVRILVKTKRRSDIKSQGYSLVWQGIRTFKLSIGGMILKRLDPLGRPIFTTLTFSSRHCTCCGEN